MLLPAPARLHLVVAMTPERVIGARGGVPWYIKDELRHFKQLTVGHPLIMGHRTYTSIGRPLPQRHSIVLSHHLVSIPGAFVVHSLPEALARASALDDDVFVIGGGTVFAQTLPLADVLHISHVRQSFPGDVYFPAVDFALWDVADRQSFAEFEYVAYKRKNASTPSSPI